MGIIELMVFRVAGFEVSSASRSTKGAELNGMVPAAVYRSHLGGLFGQPYAVRGTSRLPVRIGSQTVMSM